MLDFFCSCAKQIAAGLLLASLCGMAPALADDTPYSKGMRAYGAKDFAAARKEWAQSLAEGGPDEALNNLGFLYYHGLGGDARPGKAVALWRKGAALAVSESQLHLGQALEAGKGVDRNLVAAYAWYRCSVATAGKLSRNDRAEASIEKDAIAALAKLAATMSAAEREAGGRFALTLIAKYSEPLSMVP
ncbi:MAG: hypothetical protein V4631_03970 [Pseudomonadota bacterium]